MKICSQNYNINRNNVNLRNTAMLFKGLPAISQLKNIDGNFCACCGHDLILSADIAKMWAKISKPLSEVINYNSLKWIRLKYPNVFTVLEGFAKNYPQKPLAEITIDKTNHKTIMDEIEKTLDYDTEYLHASQLAKDKEKKDRLMRILKVAEDILMPSGKIMEYLLPFKKYIHGYREEIIDEFEYLSEKYPDKRLSEILKLPNVAEYFIESTYIDAMKFAHKRDKHWGMANEIILKHCPEAENKLDKMVTDVCTIYSRQGDPKRIKYLLKNLFKEVISEYKLYDIEKSVIDEIEQMPEGQFTHNSFLSYARRYYTDGALINFLIKPFMESEEHIIPIANGGKNTIYNELIMCRLCNRRRSQLSYTEFSEYHPELLENIPKQVNFISGKILDGTVNSNLATYPIGVAKTLRNYTHGLINIDNTNYVKSLENNYKINLKSHPELYSLHNHQ